MNYAETWEEEGTAELVLQQNVSRLEVRLGEGDQLEDITLTCTVEDITLTCTAGLSRVARS